jgi:hypothetical protein
VTYKPGQAVIVARGAGTLLGIVWMVGRARYAVKPARLVDGVPQAIAAFLPLTHLRGKQLQAFDPAIHINPWRVR